MKLISALIFSLTLSACQPESLPPTCGGYGCVTTHKTELGLKIRSDNDITIDLSSLDKAYRFVSTCLGVWYNPDLVIIYTDEFNSKYAGWYQHDKQDYILLRYDKTTIIQHEFIHYLLQRSTGNPDPNHNSLLFDYCVDPFLS
jgi:hypothetical protein